MPIIIKQEGNTEDNLHNGVLGIESNLRTGQKPLNNSKKDKKGIERHEKLIEVLKHQGENGYESSQSEMPWRRPLANKDGKFARFGTRHPHFDRKLAILKKVPLIRSLYGPDQRTKWVIMVAMANLLLLSWHFGKTTSSFSLVLLVVASYTVGATLQGIQDICTHECCHGLVADTPLKNIFFNLMLNIGIPVPMAMSFDHYHPLHHVYQGEQDKDPDMPMLWEIPLIRGRTWGKMIIMAFAPIMYALRAVWKYGGAPTKWEIVNIVLVVIVDFLIYNICGPRGLLFLLLSFFLGHSFHPAAGHFIQEHYTWQDGQETYNYYGWANTLFLNIGFHVEHHDFPTVSAWKLPLVTALAYEYYSPLECFRSWRRVIWTFLTDPTMGPVSRVVRE